MYSFDQSEQLRLFLTSLGVGFLLGIVYDLLRAVRLCISKSKAAVFIFDLLYFSVFALCSFFFILAANHGEVRFYLLFGEILGALFYYFSFGIAAKKLTEFTVRAVRKICRGVFIIISAPFRGLFRIFRKISAFFRRILKKTDKKSKQIHKKLLPKARICVYNLIGVVYPHKFRSKGSVEAEDEKEKDV